MTSNPPYLYVADEESLSVLCARLRGTPRVAIDTEADSLHHYYEKVCLIQITVGNDHFIVDPLAGLKLDHLMELLAGCPLLLHGADYDLRMLRRDFEFQAVNVFDTMIAAQLLGYEKFSLQALVERVHGVVLDKHGQKADWSRRPLTSELLHYAQNDTAYLETVADKLREELEAAGRLAWHTEMCTDLLATVDVASQNTVDPDRQWRVKGWHSLKSRRAQAILRELWAWRDEEARRSDVPPFRVLGNEPMVQLASWAHENNGFTHLPRLPRNCLGRRLRALKDAITRGRNIPEAEQPHPLPVLRHEHVPDMDLHVKALRGLRDEFAAKLAIDPGLLLPVATLNIISRVRPRDPSALVESCGLYSWQVELLGEQIIAAVRGVLDSPQHRPPHRPRTRRRAGTTQAPSATPEKDKD